MIFRPTESSEKIVDFYRGYLTTTFSTNNENYNRQLQAALSEDKAIADGPYISMTDPYEKGANLVSLVNEGIVSSEILKMKSFHPQRSLYRHQEEAIRKASEGKNLIVTTGTGSGKTESFLIPLINYLLKEKENGTLSAGVRALIIYPMNALVNDQIRRLREIFSDYADCGITFGKFTGETEETYKKALKKYQDNGDVPLDDCELISREQMRNTPPNILITNYAMLEYMLLRPGDNIIFDAAYADKWKYIVFDEAHSYTGAKGIEVGTLVKRIKAMLDRNDINFILTSATLGDKDSDDKIVQFGTSLCNAKFDPSCIIRSYTVEAQRNRDSISIDFQFYRDLAEKIRNDVSDEEKLKYISECNLHYNGNNYSSAIYDIILHDDFYVLFRHYLYKKVKTVKSLAAELKMSENDVTDFITVASSAHTEAEKLFEAKYHMFIRGIEGVFVTLKPLEKLFIHQMENYHNPEDDKDYKVFQVSFCSNCSALFITAENVNGQLVQRSKYTNDSLPDVYLLSEEEFEEDNDDENEEDGESIFYVCSCCGEIKHTITQLECGHGAGYAAKLRRVKKKNEELHKCPCCHTIDTHRSIIRPYYLGSEAATSVISTALYNEIPGKQVIKGTTAAKKGLFGKIKSKTNEEEKELVKQFIAFSDNRQAAAFFASYLQYTHNATIVKRIFTEIINEKSEWSFNDFIKEVSVKIGKSGYNLEQISTSYDCDAWIYVLNEMSNFKAKNSLQSLGIMQFDVDLDSDDCITALPEYNLKTVEETKTLFRILFRDMMHDSAVTVGISLVEADWKRISVSGFRRSYTQSATNNKKLIAWLPEESKTNRRIKTVCKLLDISEDKARELLNGLWEHFADDNSFLNKDGQNGYLLDHSLLTVKKVDKLYCCSECMKITPYNLNDKCENPNCKGTLHIYNADTSKRSAHYRNMYRNLEIVPMKVAEHTAQLSADTAAEYQRNFKNQKINVLSCSTTFEMGVDVGSLETVFMRNMPPTPANYAQRAGRAGRSFYSAAYAITYCPNSSHDLNYFKNPVEMINGTIYPPYFNMDNEKIVLRHVVSSALSCFWKKHPDLYKREIGNFMDEKGFDKFKEYLQSNPTELKEYLLKVVPEHLQKVYGIEEFSWVKSLFSDETPSDGICDIAIAKYNDEITKLEEEKKVLFENGSRGVDALSYSINTIKNQGIIEFLSKNNIIPKYGFPVDTVELIESSKGSHPLRLSRDLFTAISEYAPGSEIVANGKLITSRYIKRLSGYEWPTYKYLQCEHCRSINQSINVSSIELRKCVQCGEDLVGSPSEYIIPKFGFIAEKNEKDVGINKPERTYHGAISYIGDEKNIEFAEYDVNGMLLRVGKSAMDSLLVLNESPFFVCKTCGYTTIKDGRDGTGYEFRTVLTETKSHNTPSGYKCNNKRLQRFSLGHEFKTDVIMLKFPLYVIDSRDIGIAWSILYSLLEGLSRCLNIDRKELSGCLQWFKDDECSYGNFGFVLFDNTPGGAGYVRQLEAPKLIEKMFNSAYSIVKNCDCGGVLADTSCYNCLRNYYNQKQHEIIKRKYAMQFFEKMMGNNAEIIISQRKKENPEPETMKIEFLNKGRIQINDMAEEIWHNLSDDCDDEEFNIIEKIAKMCHNPIVKPIYNEQIRIVNTGEVITVNELWPERKIMLFISDNSDDYEIAKKTGWTCYLVSESMDIYEFLKRIEV